MVVGKLGELCLNAVVSFSGWHGISSGSCTPQPASATLRRFFLYNMLFLFRMCALLRDQFANRISHRRKLLLILRHHITFHHLCLIMKVKGMCQELPSCRSRKSSSGSPSFSHSTPCPDPCLSRYPPTRTTPLNKLY